jgi:hypothetical protein
MAAPESKEKPTIFLNDPTIVAWKKPSVEIGGALHISTADQFSRLLATIGFDTMDEEVGPYRLCASAAIYAMNLARLGPSRFNMGGAFDGEITREALFTGGIDIYQSREITGTDVDGYELVRHGRIWAAVPIGGPEDRLGGLKKLILGEDYPAQPLDITKERVEAILRGYWTQEDESGKVDLSASIRNRGGQQERGFGGGPC